MSKTIPHPDKGTSAFISQLNRFNLPDFINCSSFINRRGRLIASTSRGPSSAADNYFSKLFGLEDFVLQEKQKLDSISGSEVKTSTAKDYTLNPIRLNLKEDVVLKSFVILDVFLDLKGKRFKTISLDQAPDQLPKSTSSGFPEYTLKSRVIDHTLSVCKRVFNNNLYSSIKNMPITIGFRTQMRKTGLKFRQIYVMPYVVLIFESMLFSNLLSHFESTQKYVSFNYNSKFPDLAKFWLNCQKPIYSNILSIDLKAFDLSVSNDLIAIFYRWSARHIRMNESEFASFKFVRYFNTSPIIATMIEGKLSFIRKQRGVMSGSFTTNFMDSIINLFCLIYYCVDNGIYISSEDVNCKGDDIIIANRGKLDLQSMVTYYKENFGLDISPDNSETFKKGDKIFYLGHFFDSKARYIDEEKTKKQLCFTERYIKKDVMTSFERRLSKAVSICCKCTDGKMLLNQIIQSLQSYYKIEKIPKMFYNFLEFHPNYKYLEVVPFNEYYLQGWCNQ